MTNQFKNPVFWGLVSFLSGFGFGAWGLVKRDCIGPECWVGSGFLLWTGGSLIVIALVIWAMVSYRKRYRS